AEAIKAAHQAERAQAEETRLKAAEAGEHALRAAEERSREEARRREEFARREIERKEREEAEARRTAAVRKATQQPKPATPPPPPPPAANTSSSRTPILVAVLLAAAAAVGGYLYLRQSAEVEAAKAEAARIAAETRAKDESDRRAKAEALAREEAEKRSRLEAEAKRQAEQAEKARAEEEARKALALKKEEEEKKKAELAARKEAEAKARAEAEAKKQAELAKAEAEKKARAEEAAKAEAAKKAEEAKLAARRPGRVFQDCPDCPRMVVVPAGEFLMGSPDSEAGRFESEGPQRTVRIRRAFALGRSEVTQGEWRAVMGSNPSSFSGCGDDCPVERVSWNDAREFARRLSEKTGKRYRLPTEAEWEYACRAGGSDLYCGGGGVDALAWYGSNSSARTQRVAQKRPNAFGLYDMSGNVWEWTEDCWNANYNGAPIDGSAWLTGDCSNRVIPRRVLGPLPAHRSLGAPRAGPRPATAAATSVSVSPGRWSSYLLNL
ncbi:MAG: formylglycine-generating enzyme family protein, partial [Bryobacterales bacterium]|nr:formylglycine-generating enzyme family protein [Bryobacterales bacterium]